MSVVVTADPAKPFRCDLAMRHHKAVSDVDTTLKGGDSGATPHEIIHAGMAACTAMKIVARINKKKMAVTKVTIDISEDKIDDPDDTAAATTPKQQIIRVLETITIEGTVTDAELAELKKSGETCPMTAWVVSKKVVESVISRAS